MLLGDQNKIHFALGVHNHQPIGNWDRVIEDGYQHSYLPFIDVLERHPHVAVTAHYSGHLLLWLADHHPEFTNVWKNTPDEPLDVTIGFEHGLPVSLDGETETLTR